VFCSNYDNEDRFDVPEIPMNNKNFNLISPHEPTLILSQDLMRESLAINSTLRIAQIIEEIKRRIQDEAYREDIATLK
jgi:hypothetical protein